MAELILTEKEKKAATYLEWNNEAIGMGVKELARRLQDDMGDEAMQTEACAVYLACRLHEAGHTTFEVELNGVHNDKQEYGDFKITIERIAEV